MSWAVSIPYHYGSLGGSGSGQYGECDPGSPATFSHTINFTIGTDTGGWVAGTTWTENARVFRLYYNLKNVPAGTVSAMPAAPVISGNPPFCEWTDEWCVNIDNFVGSTHGGPSVTHSCDAGIFPIWWEDHNLMTMVASDLNGDPLHDCVYRNGGSNYDPTPGSAMWQQTLFLTIPNMYKINDTAQQPSGSNDLNAGDTFGRWASYNRFAYTPPSGPLTTDQTFNLTVTAYNPYSGNAVDGTHGDCDGQFEIDTVPGIDLVGGDPSSCGEAIAATATGPTRVSFGVYSWTGLRFFCQAGTRQFEVWADHEITSLIPVTQVKVPSGGITINPGAPNCVDMPQGTLSDSISHAYYLRCNEPLHDVFGADLYWRILDAVGNTCLFNVCTSDNSDALTIALGDSSGNAFITGVLNGTLTRTASSGIATFPGLSIKGLGGKGQDATETDGYTVYFSSGGGLSTSSNANGYFIFINCTTGLAFETIPTITHGVAATIKVDLVDYNGSLINPDRFQDQLTLTGGFTGGTQTVTPSGGVATFTITYTSAGSDTLSVSTSGVHYYGPGSPAPGYSDPAVTKHVTIV